MYYFCGETQLKHL